MILFQVDHCQLIPDFGLELCKIYRSCAARFIVFEFYHPLPKSSQPSARMYDTKVL
jgi:hypothetical protein